MNIVRGVLHHFCHAEFPNFRRSFQTEQRDIYQGHDARQHPVPKSFKKIPPVYERPTVPVEGLTVTHVSIDPGQSLLYPLPLDTNNYVIF